ncbi:MAG: hypothetical protein A2X12_10680 [Bacteroidetes bacterium GWE2_29_8]|nr:MAG: hypothetical protein A2X12_10680 [Bacteroidetes bacterium GWE2_29_8]OFY24841.1 MAG: hypothetical protein A2X02_03850 [Bacteroidetes bacterium GWF2_29_10]
MNNKFTKKEKLCSKVKIKKLLEKGTALWQYPFNLLYNEARLDTPAQMLIIVPKRNIKKATQRNRIKRLVREVYRLNKDFFYQFCIDKNKQFELSLLYVAKKELSFIEIEKSIIPLLQKIISNEHNKNSTSNDINIDN